MTDAKRANWYSDGENAARRMEDLLLICERPPAGDAVEPTLVEREVFPILGIFFASGAIFLWFAGDDLRCEPQDNYPGYDIKFAQRLFLAQGNDGAWDLVVLQLRKKKSSVASEWH